MLTKKETHRPLPIPAVYGWLSLYLAVLPCRSVYRSSNAGWSSLRANGTHLELFQRGDQRDQVHDHLLLRK